MKKTTNHKPQTTNHKPQSFISKLLLLFVLAYTMTNCSQDTLDISKNSTASTPKNEISFEQFKNKTGLTDFKNTISLPIVYLKAQAKKIGQNQYTINDFNIDTTYIKQFIVKNKTTYTFKITPKIVMRNSIFNLTIYSKDGVWATSIIEMTPTDQNYKDLLNGNAKTFKGKMRLVYQSATDQNTINKSYAKSSGSGTGYTTVFVTGNRHCTLTGDCANGTCDNCNLCVDYYSYSMPVDGEAVEAFEDIPNTAPQGGGGNDINLTDPSGYVIDPNLFDLSNPKSLKLLQNAETAAAFWADLSDDLKAWAVVNADQYNTIFNLYLGNVSQESKDSARELINLSFQYNNTDVTWKFLENWFLGTAEGRDGNVVSDIDNVLNSLTYQKRSLPTYTAFQNNFPKLYWPEHPYYYQTLPASVVYSEVGGNLQSLYLYNEKENGPYRNACAVRISLALNKLGILIPNNAITRQGASTGGVPQYYFLQAIGINDFMIKTFGDTTVKLEGADANDKTKIAALLEGKNGIYIIVNNDGTAAGYTGHADLIKNGYVIGRANTSPKGGVKSIRIWILN